MKKKEKQTIKAMKREDMQKILLDATRALDIYAIGRFNKQIKNAREGRALKRKIAIIKTFIRQMELTHG